MLCMNKYEQKYVDNCRSRMEAQLKAYKSLGAAARGARATEGALAAFEPAFFNSLVVVLDGFFVHRSRALELKDGNPLNEVRMLCSSILQNNGVLAADKSIKYVADKAVLKLPIGAAIHISESDFAKLFKAFFAEIEAKFV